MRAHNRALANIRTDLSAMLWPPVSQGHAAALAVMVRQLEDSQWLVREALAALQFRQLAGLAAHCEKYSPLFRRRLRQAGLAAGDLASAEGLRRLPVLRRRELQGAGDLFCEEVPAGHAPLSEMRTSGSTGEPVMVRRTSVSNFDWLAITLRDFFWEGCDFAGRFCAVRGAIAEPTSRKDWGVPVSLLFDSGPSLGIPVTLAVERQAALIAQFGPDTLLVYPSTLAALAQACAARGIALPTLRHIRTFGETLSPQVRADAARQFGARILDGYSSQEVGHVASECPDAPLYHVMETVLVEILDDRDAPCPPGEIGRVVVTDLRNFATPLIRYDIGDYAEAGGACPCGRGLPTLARILGRARNLVRLPDGRRHWPLMGADYFPLRDIAPIRQYQLIQQEIDLIEFRLVSDAPLSPAQEEEIRALVGKVFTYPFRVTFTSFDGEIPKGPNGKFEIFVSRIE